VTSEPTFSVRCSGAASTEQVSAASSFGRAEIIALMSSSFAYRHSPIWAQELLLSAKSSLRSTMREGRAFEAKADEIIRASGGQSGSFAISSRKNCGRSRNRPVRNVPYYRNKYRPLDLDFEKLQFRKPSRSCP